MIYMTTKIDRSLGAAKRNPESRSTIFYLKPGLRLRLHPGYDDLYDPENSYNKFAAARNQIKKDTPWGKFPNPKCWAML
ncbi:Uncharacterised protein [Legionella steigerwaltii]|uniref:Uncharacterized protein n=1 Tax=Legionella steigerwaltii TaxID=460 RepID=A0A378L753_9GAMM|nr:hypothetical protein Lstg_1354 [Legionella steigerwaltii]STY22190.1 Uncharacterised protein [Legionella steigerwaltii]